LQSLSISKLSPELPKKMATVNTTTIYPSAKFISTDGLGDLQETVATPATKAQLSHNGLTFKAVTAGNDGNLISLEIVGDNNATGLAFTATGNSITLTAETADAIPATEDALTHDGVTYKSAVDGDSGIDVTILESQLADAISFSGSTLTIELDDLVTNKTQGDILALYQGAGTSVTDAVEITVADSLGALATTLTNEPLTGGVDEVPAVTIANYTQGQVSTAFGVAPSGVTDLVTLEVQDANANLSSLLGATNLSGGNELVAGSLEADADYILIKTSDIYGLSADEANDGRKVVWGLVDTATKVFEGLSDAPDNFTMSQGTLTSVANGTALRRNYSIQAFFAVENLDLKSEA
jgi:hypothetical protein